MLACVLRFFANLKIAWRRRYERSYESSVDNKDELVTPRNPNRFSWIKKPKPKTKERSEKKVDSVGHAC